jgi:ribosomal protein L6P/L9E
MSKIGNQVLKVPSNLTIKIVDNLLEISSKLGKITHKVDSRFIQN